MSRIGNNPISLPQGVSVSVDNENNTINVKGKLGELSKTFHTDLSVNVEEDSVTLVVHQTARNINLFIA